MERRDKELDGLQWPFMAASSPNSQETHHYEVTYPQNPSLKNHLSQNLTSLNHLYQNNPRSQYHPLQNPNSQDHLFQIPLTTQNHHTNLLLPENYPLYHMNPPQYNGVGSMESVVQVNPSFTDFLYGPSLETSLSPLNLSPSRLLEDSFANLSIDMGGAVRGQCGQVGGVTLSSNSTPFEYRNSTPLNSNSTPFEYVQTGAQNLPRSNSTQLKYGNQIGGQNFLVAPVNRSSSSWPNISNDFYLQHRSFPANEFDDYFAANRNGTRIDSRFQRCPRSINGLDSDSVNVLMSSLHNHQDVRSRRRRSSYSSLEELKGRMSLEAKDQQGCRFLQETVKEDRPEDIQMIFLEVKDDLHELIVDPVANYLIQKLIEACNEEQMTELIHSLVNDEEKLMDICVHSHGTRAIQKLLEHVTTRHQMSLLISALKGITVTLTKSMHGHHIIQQCFRQFSNEETKHLLDEIAENCLDIATDKSGCCVLQQCVDHAEGEPKERLIAEITANALVLSEHPYGNYVVQYLLGMKIPRVTADVLAQLGGSYVNLSMNKYGSNVVEKCMKESGAEQTTRIIKELVKDPDFFLQVLQDPYGNYVVQKALLYTKGYVRQNLVNLIHSQSKFLHSNPYGKKVLAKSRNR